MEFHDEIEKIEMCDDQDCFVCLGEVQPRVHYEHRRYSTLDGELQGPADLVISSRPGNQVDDDTRHARFVGSYDEGSRSGTWHITYISNRRRYDQLYVTYEQDDFHGPAIKQIFYRGVLESSEIGRYCQGVKCGTWYYTNDIDYDIEFATHDVNGNIVNTGATSEVYGKTASEWPKDSHDLFEWWSDAIKEE
jgi:hypothetical protein